MEEQGSALKRVVRERKEAEAPSSFEQVTRRGLDDLTRQVERLETKINGLLVALASSILIDLYRTLIR
ncbi:MAG TPA: hypothetical protein VFZ25_18420 [Chloroflexota bacterium]|nr:hypothetical protein [Chloroflexota bacterium]